jgi:hypothetical protein
MQRIACIGSRGLGSLTLNLLKRIGERLVYNGWEIHTGNAPGADYAFASGGNKVNPGMVHLHLPWSGFNKDQIHSENILHCLRAGTEEEEKFYYRVAEHCHPNWRSLSSGGKSLMLRNTSILFPPGGGLAAVDFVLACSGRQKGGTGQGLRIAKVYDIPYVDMQDGETNREHDPYPREVIEELNDRLEEFKIISNVAKTL